MLDRQLTSGRCGSCGETVADTARFCSACGAPLYERADVQPTAGDELRPVTALFADIVGSTQLGERLTPDEVKALIGECVSRMSAAVEEFGGTVQAYLGDGICAYFGVPRTREDDAERAARAALRILDVVSVYSADVEAAWAVESFDVRIGINGGKTAVGLVGSAEPRTVALGDATNVAARLQAAARPGTILVGESTAKELERRFALEPAGRLAIKGREQKVEGYLLAGLRPSAAGSPRPRLAGRAREMALLQAMMRDLDAGRGQILLLSGQAGIGKTRMLEELQLLAADRAVWLQGHCLPYRGLPLAPLIEALRSWLGVEEGDARITVRTKTRARLGAFFDDRGVEELIPAFDRLLMLELAGPSELSAPDPLHVGAGLRRAYVDWLRALAARSPVVLALEDLQWADTATLALAENVLDLADREPVLFASTLRVDEASDGSQLRLRALGDYAHRALELALDPLPEDAARHLLTALMPGLDPDTRDALVTRAGGNPLYLEELVRALSESGSLERQRTWTIEVGASPVLPASLESLLLGLVDMLPASARRVLQMAAAIGRTFPLRPLERLHDNDVLETDIRALLRMQLVQEVGRYPERVYEFKHVVLQEAVLSTLPAANRIALYRRVAAVFEELYPERLERLAHYYAQGSEPAKALEFLEAASSRAVALGAPVAALQHLDRARRIASSLGDDTAGSRIAASIAALEALTGETARSEDDRVAGSFFVS
jgi:class 3 adenylate cyclase